MWIYLVVRTRKLVEAAGLFIIPLARGIILLAKELHCAKDLEAIKKEDQAHTLTLFYFYFIFGGNPILG